ncbi:MAG: hydrogenase [Firmicutes bacterium]|nr:hydrogenase [Bacillota bacterium]
MDKEKARSKEMTRRSFLKMFGSMGLVGAAGATLTGCSKDPMGGEGWLPQQYQAAGPSYPAQVRGRIPIDPMNPSITRDDEKCILCGQCLEVCENVQTVFGYYELPIKDEIICVNCGQCSLWCPTAAITEKDDTAKVLEAINDPETVVVVQTAPATRVGLGEEFGLPAGAWVEGKQVAALKKLGFDYVFDTNFTADLTIMEEGTELIQRIKGVNKAPLPQFTSCSPGWVKFFEYYYPDLIPNMSSAKSPQQMLGTLIKTYFAEEKKIEPKKIFSVSIMPCTAKKFECSRPEMNSAGEHNGDETMRDVDVVLTVRELARMIKKAEIDLNKLSDKKYDTLMGVGSGAGLIFGATGGVMEAAVRTAYFVLTDGQDVPAGLLNLQPVRGLEGVKDASLDIPGVGTVKIAVAHGLKNARTLMDQVRSGESPYHFIELMCCPGGCISGGGQPRTALPPSDEVRKKRIASLYEKDSSYKLRLSHENPEVIQIYEKFLHEPISHLAHELLHTEYTDRGDKLNAKKQV